MPLSACHHGAVDEQLPIELILVRQLAGYLATPVFVVDEAGRLVYYNEAAEEVLGARFEDTTLRDRDEWLSAFMPRDPGGAPFGPDEDPLLSALADGRERPCLGLSLCPAMGMAASAACIRYECELRKNKNVWPKGRLEGSTTALSVARICVLLF